MNKEAVCIIKNYDDDILEENAIECCDNTALDKEAAWIVAWELRDSCTLIKYVTETVKNDDVSALEKEVAEAVKSSSISALDKEAAWMIAVMLRNDCTLVKDAIKIVKDNDISDLEKEAAEAVKNYDISAFNKEVTSALDE